MAYHYWREIRNDHFVTNAEMMPEDGDIAAVISIDAWKTDADCEEGVVIAQVFLSQHSDILVAYHDPVARIDSVAQASIREAKQRLRDYRASLPSSDKGVA